MLGKILIVLIFTTSATDAMAQQSATLPAAARPPAPDNLEVVVVTAQVRSESLQDVPLSITAISGEALASRNITDAIDLTSRTPGVVGALVNGVPQISIRGIGTNDFGIGADPAVGVYIDGVYASRTGQLSLDLFDIKRVEIVKGPQGTLFGRSAAAGAISVITRPPSRNWEGDASAEFAARNALRARGTVSGPIVADVLSFRLSGLFNRQDGFIDNVAPSGGDFENANDLGGRLALQWTPSTSATITFSADYLRKRRDGNGYISTLPDQPGGVADLFRDASSDLGRDARADLNIYGASANAAFDLADGISLVSITAYRGYETRQLGDDDGTVFNIIHTGTLPERSNSYSQELRLNSTRNPDFTWFLGASAFLENVSSLGVVRGDFKDWLDTGTFAGLSGDPSLTSLSALGLPDTSIPFEERAFGSGRYQSYAVYGDATLRVTGGLSLTAGVRLSHDRKRWRLLIPPIQAFVALGLADLDPATPDLLSNLLFAAVQTPFRSSLSATTLQPRFVARYEFNDDINVYASASRGYKPGGFNNFGDQPPFAPESIWAYEAGLKAEFFERRLRFNVAAFRYDYRDLQVTVVGAGQLTTVNAGAATGDGLEIELLATPVTGLRIGGSLSLLDARYGRSNDPRAAARLPVGNRLIRAPETQFTVFGDYEHNLGSAGSLRWLAEYFWQSRVFFDPDNDPVLHSQPGYGLLRGSLAFQTRDERWEITVFVDNALDERYIVNRGGLAEPFGYPTAIRGEPRRVGARVNFRY